MNRSIMSGMAMAMCCLSFGSDQLRSDGILIVKGLPLDGSQVIVLTKDGEAQILTEGLSHFTLDLDLQKDYLVSFERPGCVSKQLRFNTYVPGEFRSSEGFRFPFQVTLEPAPEGQHMEYAGPVGYIHFDEKLGDFSYSTDYRVLKDHFLAEELELVQSKLKSNREPVASILPAPAEVEIPVASTRSPNTIKMVEPVPAQDVIAPTVSRTPPMVHVLGSSDAPTPPTVIRPEPMPAPAVQQVVPVVHATEESTAVVSVKRLGPEILDAPVGVEKEVQVDSLRVVTIIRFRKGTDTDEYRRVVSYYGGTTYFCNGYACSADTYEKQINR